ncbi:MAG: fumarylacetoacetate hydrolase family protein [Alphaproteobacteria bacterium]|nr:fumarylacetoacetate hydrolase family protein [Alphaproteobacteria bacterium]
MKIVSFQRGAAEGFGVVEGDGVIDVSARMGPRFANLRKVLEAGALHEVADAAKGARPDRRLAELTLLPPVTDPAKIICVGVNYDEHRKETGRDPSAHPVLFTRWADTQVGHGQAMVKPRNSDRFDYEGELAVIIGRECRHAAAADALSCIAGYSCYHDGSVRDWQRHTHQFTPGKNFPATGGFGPWMVTADEIPDPQKLHLTTRLNGQVVQDTPTDLMIFDVRSLIVYISAFTTLRPGDVIITGTPGGVGDKRNPPLYMKGGDVAEVEIRGIGILRNPIVNEG